MNENYDLCLGAPHLEEKGYPKPILSKNLYCDEGFIIKKAILKFGIDAQTDVAIEEMAELTQALIHNRRGRPANIAEEIADVEIMLEQLKIIHNCADEVEKQKDAKLKRLAFKLQREGSEQS